MEVIERKPIPIYEVECYECHSKIQYKAREVSLCQITCPVCGISLWANTICPVRMESENKDDKTKWCSEVGGERMSVDRDTLARVHGIQAEQVTCANCARHSEFINDVLWCDGWDAPARADEFCSFYEKESEEKDD